VTWTVEHGQAIAPIRPAPRRRRGDGRASHRLGKPTEPTCTPSSAPAGPGDPRRAADRRPSPRRSTPAGTGRGCTAGPAPATRIGAGAGGLRGQVAHEQPHEAGRPDVVSSQHDDFAEASQQDCAVAVSKHWPA